MSIIRHFVVWIKHKTTLPTAVQHGLTVKEPQQPQGSVCSFPFLSGLQTQVHLQEPRAVKHPQVC